MTTPDPACGNCRFMRPVDQLLPNSPLACHYDPPVPSTTEWGWQAWGWPTVDPISWCGKHEPLPPAPAPPALVRLTHELAELGWTVDPASDKDRLQLHLYDPEGGYLVVTHDLERLRFRVTMYHPGITSPTWQSWVADEQAVGLFSAWSDQCHGYTPMHEVYAPHAQAAP